MTQAEKRFFDFLHEHNESPRFVEHYEDYIRLATAIFQAEKCGFVIDPDSVYEACRLVLEG